MSPEDHKVRTDTPGGVSLRCGLKISHLGGLQLQLELIRDQGDEFGIRGFSLDMIAIS